MNQLLQRCHLGWTGERIRCEEKGRDRLVCDVRRRGGTGWPVM